MINKQIARTLKLTASLIELTGGNDFRARAFASAARAIDSTEESAARLAVQGELTSIQGIGQGLAADIQTLVETGTFDTLEQLLAAVPPGLLDVLRLKGFGPKKVRALWQHLGVTNIDDLEEMALTGRIAALDGFGKKTEEKILEEIRRLRTFLKQRHYFDALDGVAPLLEALLDRPDIIRAETTGALRRKMEVVSEVEVIVCGDEAAIHEVLEQMTLPAAGDAPAPEDAPGALQRTLADGLPLIVHQSTEADFARQWLLSTGSGEHVAAFRSAHGAPEPLATEHAIFAAAGLAYIPPELRENRGEFDAAREDAIPGLISTGDLAGTIHNHTTASDGVHTLREMADAARAMGYEYFGLSDHSRSLVIASGLSIPELQRQAVEVKALNEEYAHDGGTPFRIFHGNEVDILSDGTLDYPDEVLEQLDFVVASVHTRFGMTVGQATDRILSAVYHPLVDVIGHMTGRILLRREGYPVDHRAIIDACAETGTAIELNANPYRLDMDWRYVREAVDRGVLIAINPDAHSTDELRHVQWGVAVARKGWLTAEGCLNAKSASDFAAWLAERRVAAGTATGA